MATKNDWQEYFELMNDRKPTEEEINAAIASGEIDVPVQVPVTEAMPEFGAQSVVEETTEPVSEEPAEQVQEVAPEVVEEPAVQPVAEESAEQVVTPEVSTAPVAEATTQATSAADSTDQMQQMIQMQKMMQEQQAQHAQQMMQMQAKQAEPSQATTFFNDFTAWAKSVFSQPDPNEATPKKHQFELYTMIANAIVFGLIAVVSSSRVVSSLFSFTNMLGVSTPYGMMDPGYMFKTLLTVSLAAFGITMAIVVAAWAVRRGVYRDSSVTFQGALEYVGRPMVLVLALNLVGLIALVLSIYGLFSFMLILGLSLFGFINLYTLFTSKNYTNMNNFYVTLIATMVNGFIVSTITWLAIILFIAQSFV